MFEINATLDDYRHADPETRLDLFLGHRDLREPFDRIESEETGAPVPRLRSRPALAPLRRVVRRCCSWVV